MINYYPLSVSALVLLKHFVALVYSQKYHQLFSPIVIFISALLYLNFYFVDVFMRDRLQPQKQS